MQNWGIQTASNYDGFSKLCKQIFADNIKKELNALDSGSSQTQQHPLGASWISPNNAVVENFFKPQNHLAALGTNIYSMPTSPANNSMPGGSNTDQHHSLFDPTITPQQIFEQLQQNFEHAQQAASKNQFTSHVALGFNPLTPPGLPQAILTPFTQFYNQSTQHQDRNRQKTLSPMSILENSEKATLTPRHTPPMDITPPKSPKATNGTNVKHDQHDQEIVSNCDDNLKYIGNKDEEGICSPIFNSHGKMKNYKCKSCGYVAITKGIFWDHAKTHMKPEKILQCEKCPFVTELKHHLEYHTRKHKNLKPFQCDKCSYSCVNKSMLNSHRKSHSSVYPYRCTDCNYATKYCHSFKLHLRKYKHKQGTVLDEDGKPNPSLVIDVYGTRRGPKNKSSSSRGVKKENSKYQTPECSERSATPQTTTHPTNNKISTSPNKNSSLGSTEQSAVTLNMSLMQQQQATSSQISPAKQSTITAQNSNIPHIYTQLSASLPQPTKMDILSYWNFRLAQQGTYVLLLPSVIEQLQKYQQDQSNQQEHKMEMGSCKDEDENEEEDVESEFDRKSIDSAMDLSRGTPIKDDQQQQTPESVSNAKIFVETPASSSTAPRHKGRTLKLDKEQLITAEVGKAFAPLATSELDNYAEDQFSSDKYTKTNQNYNSNSNKKKNKSYNPPNTNATSVTSFSHNNSNSSATTPIGSNSSGRTSPSGTSNFYECIHCGIIFKNPVLHSMHMGFHTCNDVFKCNKCGVRCNSSIAFFLHISCKAHS